MRAFTDALPAIRPYLRAMCLTAARDLSLDHGLDAACPSGAQPNHRLRALLRVLCAEGTLALQPSGALALARPDDLRPPDAPSPWVPTPPWDRVAAIIRLDRPHCAPQTYEHLYQQAMARATEPPALSLCARLRDRVAPQTDPHMLDVGGGLGTWARAFLSVFPEGSASVIERGDVAALAAASTPPNAPPLRWIVGDAVDLMFSDIGAFDWVVMSNVIHWYPLPAIQRLLTGARARLRAGGRILIKDFAHPDPHPDGQGDPQRAAAAAASAYFGLSMALQSDGGDVYTRAEVCDALSRAGFSLEETSAVPDEPGVVCWWGLATHDPQP